MSTEAIPEEPSPSRLEELLAAANLQYSLKNYNGAADIYSEAAQVQEQLNGEMAPENADLLFRYGRCLYKVAIAKSDVLGGRVASEEKPAKKQKNKPAAALPSQDEKLAEEVVEAAVEEKDGVKSEKEPTVESKPFFQIVGDENWDTESDEEDGGEEEGGEEDPEDDLATAYEILDVARVLLSRQLEALQNSVRDTSDGGKGKGKAPATELDPEERKVMEKLADTHDLQAEIGLENENFVDAVSDFRAALALKEKYLAKESSLIAEAHYKLSLALEFQSMTKVREAQAQAEASGGKVNPEEAKVDEDMRAEAAKEMEKAIESCRLRVSKEEEALASVAADKAEEAKAQITDVKEMIEDMENRLTELRGPAISLSAPSNPAGADPSNPLSGILGELLGQAPAEERAEQKKKIEGASDISGLVKRKKPAAASGSAGGASKNDKGPEAASSAVGTKRKSEAPEDSAVEKKAKVEDA
ncbi:Tetratricopeptide repeat domain protein [Lasiodiplodia theobromae]|uniref:Tetratricopeptide repeat domain protein n=1 Tax=Lasiodiplodia theobromae TaxID=45133 RepID=UPI0015C2D489|nr:Tetratricopeptide repeat domain protein [Lasiodiplodia theobromae]KAF4540887.1 Tetratricopeptide repeat domain protein [Lasiodiplodia theobromae]